jgi:glucosamine--fructose-6-phosphate aminotransferase (isomerizing)
MQQLIGEIMEQPQVLERILEQEYPHMCEIAGALRGREIRQVLIVARGSSDNAATYAKYLLGARNRLPVALAAPSLYTIYGAPPRLRDTLVLGISQSGTSPDIVAVIEDARQQGMPTLAITNATASRLAAAAQWVVPLGAGEERSVAATKTYTAELMPWPFSRWLWPPTRP